MSKQAINKDPCPTCGRLHPSAIEPCVDFRESPEQKWLDNAKDALDENARLMNNGPMYTPPQHAEWEREFDELFTMEWDKHASWQDFQEAVSPENVKSFIHQTIRREKEKVLKSTATETLMQELVRRGYTKMEVLSVDEKV